MLALGNYARPPQWALDECRKFAREHDTSLARFDETPLGPALEEAGAGVPV